MAKVYKHIEVANSLYGINTGEIYHTDTNNIYEGYISNFDAFKFHNGYRKQGHSLFYGKDQTGRNGTSLNINFVLYTAHITAKSGIVC